MCPFKCGSSFTTANNMYIHVEREVCHKDLKEQNMIWCRFEDCEHETVTQSAMHNHKMGHLGLKDYICPDPSCGQSFGHGSSLINHKYGIHYDIFKPLKSWMRVHGVLIGMSLSGMKNKKERKGKKKKHKKETKKKPKFSSSESDSD